MAFVADNPAVYLTYWPDWSDQVKVRYRWQTGIQTTIVGKEQRSAYRSQFVRQISFSLTNLSFAESAWLLRNLQRHGSEVWAVPLFSDVVALSVNANQGTSLLSFLDLTDLNFVEGAQLILLAPDTDTTLYEVATIQTVDLVNQQITLGGNLTHSWTIGQFVCPLILGYVNKEDILYLTSEHSSGTLTVTQVDTGSSVSE